MAKATATSFPPRALRCVTAAAVGALLVAWYRLARAVAGET